MSFEKVIIGDAALYCADCREALKTLADNSVDSIVTDPPYELTSARPSGRSEATRGAVMGGFMGLKWDATGIAHDVDMWAECLRVLKPGGHLLAFSSTRTQHRMVCAIEDAGFEIRDQIPWIYGSGFPKSRNLDGDHKGWGTALKPANEPICMARKPLAGTVAENVLMYGTGALNIDACRIPGDVPVPFGNSTMAEGWRLNQRPTDCEPSKLGRWPANLIHDGSDEVLACFPQAPGQLANASTNSEERKTQNVYGALRRGRGQELSADSENAGVVGFNMKLGMRRLDSGSAARFFYCAKTSRTDRNEGCEALADKDGGMNSNTSGQHITRRDGWKPEPVKNNHPTVKPTDLMAYLCRLITPPGGLVLDPFMGSGSTGKACAFERFRFIGIERESEYMAIAQARITHAQAQPIQESLFA